MLLLFFKYKVLVNWWMAQKNTQNNIYIVCLFQNQWKYNAVCMAVAEFKQTKNMHKCFIG